MANIPNQSVDDYRVILYAHDNQQFDITAHINEILLWENIYYPFTYGEISVIDNAGIASKYPLIGQERIEIIVELNHSESEPLHRMYHVGGIQNVQSRGTGYGTINLKLLGLEQLTDLNYMFSRYLTGISTDIIAEIYNDHFHRQVEVEVQGVNLFNLITPYSTPLAVIKSILARSWAEDGTPLYLFDRLYADTVHLTSYKEMIDQDPVYDISPEIVVNRDDSNQYGYAHRYAHTRRGLLTDYNIATGYDTFRQLAKGTFKHTIEKIDYATKKFESITYNYRENGQLHMGDYLSDAFFNDITDKPVVLRRYQNSLGYDSESIINLGGSDPLEFSIAQQHRLRENTVVLVGTGDYIPTVQVGKPIWVNLFLHLPTLKNQESEQVDRLNSGKYVVAGIKHQFLKKGDIRYTAQYQFIRDGVNNEE